MPTSPKHQSSLHLIAHEIEHAIVEQRASDGYINATAICKASGKLFGHYNENATTQAYLNELFMDIGIPIAQLIQVLKPGLDGKQVTWVHPQVAINLGMWVSPKFAVQVTKWVHEWMSGKAMPTKLPYHLERHMLNYAKVPTGFFSVLQEMTNRLVAPMEANGYRLPEKLVPDISQAKMLCKYLREKHGIDTNNLDKYEHEFPDGRKVEANLYPIQYLGDFAVLLDTVWMPQRAAAYFKTRDPDALLVLDKMLMVGMNKAANKALFKKKA